MNNSIQYREFWLGRWKRGEIGWHQHEVEPALVKWLSDRQPEKIFVPLCGKSIDMKWLSDQGHRVIGCEISEDACETFFEEHSLPYQVTKQGPFKVFQGASITIYCGDIFDLSAANVGTVNAVYDRAALIALPAELRKSYADHLLQLLAPSISDPLIKKKFEFLQLILTRTPNDTMGPPYSVTQTELGHLYGRVFHPELLLCEEVETRDAPDSSMEECVLLFRPK